MQTLDVLPDPDSVPSDDLKAICKAPDIEAVKKSFEGDLPFPPPHRPGTPEIPHLFALWGLTSA